MTLTATTTSVERWVAAGRVLRFADLPREAQKSFVFYMAVDGEAWDGPESLYTGSRTLTDEHLPHFIERYASTRVGLTYVSLDDLKAAVLTNPDVEFDNYDDYHRSYARGMASDRGVPEGGKEVWPVILDRDYDEVIQDGWHRFHSYAERGVDPVPALFYPDEVEA